MKLDCVLTAVNEVPLYLEFLPIFVDTWKKLYPHVDVKVVLVAKAIPEEYLAYKENIILFEPLDGVPTAFTSQFIRLLYPGLLDYENGVMITDMDMLPMNRTYYTEHIKAYGREKFIYLRENVCANESQIAMCYNVAVPEVWRDVFDVHSLEDVRNVLRNTDTSWSSDQRTLHDKVTTTRTGYTPAVGTGSCTTTRSQSCPATNPCPADCSGGTWNYTCPTNCGYGGGNVTATRTGYTPAVGTGSCTTTRSQSCPAQPSCPEPDFVDIIFTPIDVITTPVSSGGCTIM